MARTAVGRAVLHYTLGNCDFRLLWGDSIFNGFGMSGEQVVLSLLVYQLTDSSVWVGLFGLFLSFGVVRLELLLGIAVVSGSLRALYAPVRLSYAYDLVGSARAVGGLSMLNLGFRVGQLVGGHCQRKLT
jgi:hypothetical protein